MVVVSFYSRTDRPGFMKTRGWTGRETLATPLRTDIDAQELTRIATRPRISVSSKRETRTGTPMGDLAEGNSTEADTSWQNERRTETESKTLSEENTKLNPSTSGRASAQTKISILRSKLKLNSSAGNTAAHT
jgi:hypothetical protein